MLSLVVLTAWPVLAAPAAASPSDGPPPSPAGRALLIEDPSAVFVPPFVDTGEDWDDDGLFDALLVNVTVNILVSDRYFVYGELYDSSLTSMICEAFMNFTYLNPGHYDAQLTFNGHAIMSSGMDGPYAIRLQLLSVGAILVDEQVHMTDAYTSDQFEGAASFAPPHSDYGRDDDSDGTFDVLVVEVSVDVTVTATYSIHGVVMRPDLSDYISYDYNDTTLSPGTHSVELEFDMTSAWAYGEDGPYAVQIWLVDLTDGWERIDYCSHTTSPYLYTDFDPPPVRLAPPHSDYGLSTDDNPLFEHLVIAVSVHVEEAGTYFIFVGLSCGTDSLWLDDSVYLDDGPQEVLFMFSGYWIRGHIDTCSFDVHMYIFTYDWSYSEWGTHTTAEYSRDQFQGPAAVFAPPHHSYAIDTDSDSLYDYLVVNVSLEVGSAGTYIVQGFLTDGWGTIICFTEARLYLEEGPHTVELRFPGWKIRLEMEWTYFSYSVWLKLLTASGELLDTSSHLTDQYMYSSFETLPAHFTPPHLDRPVDLDGDHMYDSLVVDVYVEVETAGEFIVIASLNNTDIGGAQATLGVGHHVLPIEFAGWMISADGRDGPYDVELLMIDPEYNIMDWGTHTTSAYAASSFSPAKPRIDASWASSVPVADGVFSEGEWSHAEAVSLTEADPANRFDATMYVMNDLEFLYVCLDVVGDETNEYSDAVALVLDADNDGEPTALVDHMFVVDDGYYQYHALYDAVYQTWREHCYLSDGGEPCWEGLAAAVGYGPSDASPEDHRVFEFVIPLGLLDVSPGDVVGFQSLFVEASARTDFYWQTSAWPAYSLSWHDFPRMHLSGELRLASPVRTTASFSGTEGSSGWFVSDVEVTMTASAAHGLDCTMCRTDGGDWHEYSEPFVVSGDGVHTLEYYSVDLEGYEELTNTAYLRIDTAAPTASASLAGTEGLEGWHTGTVTVTLSADDGPSGSGVALVQYRLDSGSWTTCRSALPVSGEGEHVLEYRAVDEAGHESAVMSVTFKIDAAAPVTTCTVDGRTVTLSAADDTSGVSRVMYRVDGGAWTQYSTPLELEGSDEHSVEYYAVDVAGNAEPVKEATVPPEATAGGFDWALAAVVAAVAAAAVATALIFMRGRPKGPAPGGPPEGPPDGT